MKFLKPPCWVVPTSTWEAEATGLLWIQGQPALQMRSHKEGVRVNPHYLTGHIATVAVKVFQRCDWGGRHALMWARCPNCIRREEEQEKLVSSSVHVSASYRRTVWAAHPPRAMAKPGSLPALLHRDWQIPKMWATTNPLVCKLLSSVLSQWQED